MSSGIRIPEAYPDAPQIYGVQTSLTLYWDVGTLDWVRGTQAGGGGGGAVTVADGADVAQGSTGDAAWVSGSGTVIGILKAIAGGGSGGGLTDAQLRATPVPVSGTVTATGPLTDGQLRATPVPVSGTVTTTPPANASSNVTQFGGSAVATGVGASGAGIPRVTVANDSTVLLGTGANVVGTVKVAGNGGTIAEVDGTTFRAQRVVVKPLDQGALGQYRLSATVPLVVTQAANGTLFSFRWGNASNLCVILFLRLSCKQTAAATATIHPRYQVFIARGFTASDTVGTAITITGNAMKNRTSFGTTLVTDIRQSAVAAGLTVGTRTLDPSPILDMGTQQTITTPNFERYEREMTMYPGVHPIVFAQNEGFIVRGPTTVFGAAGTADLTVDLAWAEVGAF